MPSMRMHWAAGLAGLAVWLTACAPAAPGADAVLLAARLADRMDARDAQAALRAERRALDSNRAVAWRGTETGRRGFVQPVRTLRHGGRYCREIVHRVIAGGTAREVRGILCRAQGGLWVMVE